MAESSLFVHRKCGTKTIIISEDINTVFSALMPAATRWREIGLALKCPLHQLSLIESNIGGNRNASGFLLDMLDYRQRQIQLTWEDICRALRTDTVSEKHLANQIAKKHCPHILHAHTSGELIWNLEDLTLSTIKIV